MNNKIISSSTVPPDGPTAEAAQGAGRGQDGGGRYEERHQGAGAGAEGPGSHAAGPGTKDCGEWHTTLSYSIVLSAYHFHLKNPMGQKIDSL